jgi:hypothetical protein
MTQPRATAPATIHQGEKERRAAISIEAVSAA